MQTSRSAKSAVTLGFTGFLIHGVLPESMLTVLLVPVIKDKTGKISSIENYRPIALANIISKVFEHILMDQRKEYLVTTNNQFEYSCFVYVQIMVCSMILYLILKRVWL